MIAEFTIENFFSIKSKTPITANVTIITIVGVNEVIGVALASPIFLSFAKSTAKNEEIIAINTALNNTEPKFFFGFSFTSPSTGSSSCAFAFANTFLSYAHESVEDYKLLIYF